MGVVTFLGSDADPFVFTRVYKMISEVGFYHKCLFFTCYKKQFA